MNRIHACLLIVLMSLLSACGFHLRGSINLPPAWNDLHLASASPNSELARAFRDRLENAGISWRDRADANYTLVLGTERFDRRNLTIGGNARASEFELKMTTSLQVTDRAGNELMPETDVSSYKIITNDPENVSGKLEESRLLRREMRDELVQQLMRKLRFLATGGSASDST
ncbi:MAG: LPS assembly lipoprotein LptE [Halieaceae bacterium]